MNILVFITCHKAALADVRGVFYTRVTLTPYAVAFLLSLILPPSPECYFPRCRFDFRLNLSSTHFSVPQ